MTSPLEQSPDLTRAPLASYTPVAVRDDAGHTEQTRSDALVSVLQDWLHDPGKVQEGSA